MSFRLFIYYCGVCGGWAGFVGWIPGRLLSPENPLGHDGIHGMFLGLFLALGLSLVDALWNLPAAPLFQVFLRVVVAVAVGTVGGLVGGLVGHLLIQWTNVSAL